MLCQVEVSPFWQPFGEICFYFLHKEENKSLDANHEDTEKPVVKSKRNAHVAKITDCTNLGIRSSPVNTMDDIDVDIGKSFSKREKLKEAHQTGS